MSKTPRNPGQVSREWKREMRKVNIGLASTWLVAHVLSGTAFCLICLFAGINLVRSIAISTAAIVVFATFRIPLRLSVAILNAGGPLGDPDATIWRDASRSLPKNGEQVLVIAIDTESNSPHYSVMTHIEKGVFIKEKSGNLVAVWTPIPLVEVEVVKDA